MSKFEFDEVVRLFKAGDLPRLYDYIAHEYESRGTQRERDRIIGVLQSDKAFDAVYYDEMGADGSLADLIALIKGENK